MKKNQNGFGVIEVLLVVIIVGLIAGVGYFVYSAQKKTNQSLDNVTKGAGEVQKTEEQNSDKKTLLLTEGDRKIMKIQDAKISFTPPSGWTVEAGSIQKQSDAQETSSVVLKSPDYKEDDDALNTVTAGMSFFINTTYYGDKDIDSTQSRSASSGSSEIKTVAIGDQKGTQYFFNPGEFGVSLNTDVTKGKIFLNIATPPLKTTSLNEPYRTLYDNLVSSIKFE